MEYKLQVSSSSSSSSSTATATATSTPRSRSVSLASQGSLNNLVAGRTNSSSSSSTDNHHQATEAGGEEKEGSKAKMEKGQQGNTNNTNNNNNMIVVSDSSDTETTTVETKATKVAKAAGTGAKATTTGGPTSKASTTTTNSGVVVVPSSPPRSSVSRRSKSKTCRRVSDFTDDGTTKTSSSSSSSATTTTTSGGGSKSNSHTTATTKKRKSRSRSHSKTNNNSHQINHRAKHYVEHNYHDHKHDPIVVPTPLTVLEGAGVAAAAAAKQQQAQQQKGNHKHQHQHQHQQHHHKGGVTTPFPERLHQLLEAVDDEDLMDIVGWQPHGRCFIVHKPKEFVDSVMPRFFKQSKLTSFQRQLNLYGFCRLTTGEDRGGYYHELFIRGRVDLCSRMVRTRVKGNGSKAASSPATEPNFYRMEFCERPDGSGSCSGSSGSTTDTEMFQRDEEEAIPISPAVSTDALVSAVIDEDYPFEDCNDEFNDDEKSAGGKTPPSILPEAICSDDIGMALSESTPMLLDDTFGPLDRESTESLLDLKTAGSVPFVSPLVPSTKNVLDGSKFEMADAPTLDPFDSFFESQESIHSGDQLSFMGLPFHYLKSEDVIECLHQS